MDENEEEMPKLRALMNDDTEYFTGPDHDEYDLRSILRKAPHRPDVVIRVTVTNELTGEVVEEERRESELLWRGFRPHYQSHIIRGVAEHVATRVAYASEDRWRDR